MMKQLRRFVLVVGVVWSLFIVFTIGTFAGSTDGHAGTVWPHSDPNDSHSPGANGIPVEPTAIKITPESPTISNAIQITVGGVWSHGCVPYHIAHEVVSTAILITVATPGPEVVCGQSITPWSIMVDLGLLPAEQYQIEVQGAVTVSSTMTVLGNQIYLPVIGG